MKKYLYLILLALGASAHAGENLTINFYNENCKHANRTWAAGVKRTFYSDPQCDDKKQTLAEVGQTLPISVKRTAINASGKSVGCLYTVWPNLVNIVNAQKVSTDALNYTCSMTWAPRGMHQYCGCFLDSNSGGK